MVAQTQRPFSISVESTDLTASQARQLADAIAAEWPRYAVTVQAVDGQRVTA